MANKRKAKATKRVYSGARCILFVYGTLKTGFPLHGWIEERGKYLGKDNLAGYTLVSFGNYPAMYAVTGNHRNNFKVSGELWSVPVEDFAAIKAMEERVGYLTVNVKTESNVEAGAFIYDSLGEGIASWEPHKDRYAVKVAPDPNDDIPF